MACGYVVTPRDRDFDIAPTLASIVVIIERKRALIDNNMSISRLDWSDVELEQALRHAVQSICQTGNLQNLTVKRVRKAAEKNLKLPEEFFKLHQTWKDKSKAVIEEEAVSLNFSTN